MSRTVRQFLAPLFLGFLASGVIRAQETDNHLLVAVPPPGAVRVDGDLGDWDLSGTIEACYDLATLRQTHSVQVAAMHDAKYLYLSFRFRDPTPMENWTNPSLEPQGGWRGDAVQARFQTDQVVHLTSWYDTERKLPWASLHYGMWEGDASARDLNDALAQGVQVAFRKDPDARGYVQEMAIPWAILTKAGTAPERSFRCGLEFFWGGPKGMDWPEHRYADLVDARNPQRSFFWEATQAWGRIELVRQGRLSSASKGPEKTGPESEAAHFRTQGSVPIQYELPADGFATLVIEDASGKRVRNLIADFPRKAGWNQDFWDGRDDRGNAAPPGDYRVRGLCHGPLHLEYQFAYGNPGSPPWLTADGRGGWLSNHENPMAVASDGKQVYVAAAMAEGACTLMALDGEGRKRWGVGGVAGGPLARLGPYLYMVVGGALSAFGVPEGEIRLVRYDARSGEQVPFRDGSSYRTIARFDPKKAPPPREPEGKAVEEGSLDAAWCQRQTMGLAAVGERLYASLYFENRVIVTDGEGKPVREIALDRPAGLAAGPGGQVYAISGKTLVRIGVDGHPVPLVAQGLAAPVGLAAADGLLYVSDWGRAMNVKVFDAAGHLVRTIGRPGGRPLAGRYETDGMFLPWGLVLDGAGRLWVAEWDRSPRRVSVWSPDGRFLREFCGTTYYAAMGCAIDPFSPERGLVTGNTVDLDWKKGRWRVAATAWRPRHADALFGPGADMISRFVRKGSEVYLINGPEDFVSISRLERDGSARPLAALGQLTYFLRGNEPLPREVRDRLWDDPADLQWAMDRFPSVFWGEGWERSSRLGNWWTMRWEAVSRGKPVRGSFIWVDRNGDGRAQSEEIEFFSEEERGGPVFRSGWLPAVAPDFSVYWVGEKDGAMTIWRMPCSGWNEAGAPVYSVAEARRVLAEARPSTPDESSGWCDVNGNLLVNHDPLEMISPEGKVLWQYPNPWPGVHGSFAAPQSAPGRLVGPLYVLGSAVPLREIGEIFCLAGNMGERYLLTTDGLYVAALFRDGRGAPDSMPSSPARGMPLDGASAGGEPFGGQFFRNPLDGAYYLSGPVSEARECSVVAKLQGLETVRRLPNQVVRLSQGAVSPGGAAGAETGPPSLTVLPLARPAGGAPGPDLFNWTSSSRVARWSFDPGHSASAAWTFDDQYLYVGFRAVKDQTPMINRGTDPTRLFKTGDCAILELRAGGAGEKGEIQEGDLRLLLSVYQGRPIAVLYRYRAPGSKEPAEFASPIGVTRIDRVETLADARVRIEPEGDGYSLYAAVPLREIGFHPVPGGVYRGDFGIIYSDRSGTIDELRMYWANRQTGLVSDLASEAAIEPSRWGEFRIAR
ncbi:MAG: FlgD immunoglobulin-like domain containing protein [Methylacidiphilaceae bacterium]|nr:FlgD immunoglobulin-like domain containing protein [Candidatus Methylacidiphilaceae bacterium]